MYVATSRMARMPALNTCDIYVSFVFLCCQKNQKTATTHLVSEVLLPMNDMQ